MKTIKRLTLVKIRLFLLICFLSIPVIGFAQETQGEEPDNYNVDFYGLLRGHFSTFDGQSEIANGGSRLGFNMSFHFGNNNKYKLFIGAEIGMNLIDSEFNFNTDPNSNDGGTDILTITDKDPLFSSRYGFAGVDLDQYGMIQMGKVKGAYGRIVSKSDIFNIMSGAASFFFAPTGTDGGEVGTGRAEGAILYLNQFGKLEVGAHAQFRANGSNFMDGVSMSLLYNFSNNFLIGTAYNEVNIPNAWLADHRIIGLDEDPWYYAVNASYDNGTFSVSGTWAIEEDGDFATVTKLDKDSEIERASVVFSATGYELVGSYKLMDKKLKLMAGFNYKNPDIESEHLHKDFRKRFYLLSAQYNFHKHGSVYIESKFDDSVNQNGESSDSVLLIGIRIDPKFVFSGRI